MKNEIYIFRLNYTYHRRRVSEDPTTKHATAVAGPLSIFSTPSLFVRKNMRHNPQGGCGSNHHVMCRTHTNSPPDSVPDMVRSQKLTMIMIVNYQVKRHIKTPSPLSFKTVYAEHTKSAHQFVPSYAYTKHTHYVLPKTKIIHYPPYKYLIAIGSVRSIYGEVIPLKIAHPVLVQIQPQTTNTNVICVWRQILAICLISTISETIVWGQ